MDKEEKLKEIFENDPFGLLDVTRTPASAMGEEDRLMASFKEINEFYEKHQRAPDAGGDVQEYMLYSRLKSLQDSETKRQTLASEDKYGLLMKKQSTPLSLEDIVKDDALGILDTVGEDIFDITHVPEIKEKEEPDFVARRKPCKDFLKYEGLFKACQQDLKSGKRKFVTFNENQIKEGAYFVIQGMLVYVAKIFELALNKEGKKDGRTLTVFENGTEANVLFRSLGKRLLEDGQGITATCEEMNSEFSQNFSNISKEDQEVGFIYILKSLSKNEIIKSTQNLYKIGYSKIDVLERIKNASQDPTFLMAPVAVVTIFKCYNMNPQKLEQLLHNFFGKACLNIDVFDAKGKRHIPREWFIAPVAIIEQAIHLLISGEIIHCCYDPIGQSIVKK